MLTGNATRLKAALQDVEDNQEANNTRFSKEVAAAIPRLRRCRPLPFSWGSCLAVANHLLGCLFVFSDILAARNAAEDPAIHSVDSDSSDIIRTLEVLQSRVAELTDRARRYNRYQEILRLQVCETESS